MFGWEVVKDMIHYQTHLTKINKTINFIFTIMGLR